ncbi:DUF6445 family protein [Bacillus pretiosus]|uniref:DUF6445 family protein n=1 Tax=Bacillus TaxID=1386 RepID=UPI003D64F0DE
MFENDMFIIDDFYDDPYAIRNLALKTRYLEFENHNVPGFESEQSFYAENHVNTFKSLVQKEIVINPQKYVYGKFRYSLRESFSKSEMHIDSPDWAALVYLTQDVDCKGGLGIYKHKESGLSKIPKTGEEFNEIGFRDLQDLDNKITLPVTKDKEAWELLEFIPMKFNRMILFRGSRYFHSITEKFGDKIESARLSHNFFFNEK